MSRFLTSGVITQGAKVNPLPPVPEGAIQTYSSEKYLITKSGKYITIKAA